MQTNSEPRLQQWPLARLFLRKLILASVLLGLGIFSVQAVLEYRTLRQQLLNDLQTLGQTFVPVAAALSGAARMGRRPPTACRCNCHSP
jgi:hypothetical protein